MSTIHHIAEKLGISASTVSRAISGNGYCGKDTKDLILKTAKELNYAPNFAAKSLRTKKTGKILLAVPDICNPYYFDMINGINSVLESYGYLLILFYTKHGLKEELRAIQNLKERYADGMIMVSFNYCEQNIQAINAQSSPVVITNRYESASENRRYDTVFVDTYHGIQLAVEHLVKQGIEHIAYIGGDRKEQTGLERYEGYRDAILNAGLPLIESYVIESNYTESGGYLGLKQLLLLENRPLGIVTANDLMALGVIKACEEAGLRIPQDMAVVGMDNTDIAARIQPKLSSVALHQEEVGRQAAQILMDRLHGNLLEKQTIKIMPRLVVRDSSANAIKL